MPMMVSPTYGPDWAPTKEGSLNLLSAPENCLAIVLKKPDAASKSYMMQSIADL